MKETNMRLVQGFPYNCVIAPVLDFHAVPVKYDWFQTHLRRIELSNCLGLKRKGTDVENA